jgi:hypothetical protein
MDILIGGKEGKCHLDGMFGYAPSVRFTPGGMTGCERFHDAARAGQRERAGRTETAAVAPMRCRSQRTGCR